MPRKSGSKLTGGAQKRRTGLRNRRRNGRGTYSIKNKGRKAAIYDRPLLSYRDPDLHKEDASVS
jgi:hypothetical protein